MNFTDNLKKEFNLRAEFSEKRSLLNSTANVLNEKSSLVANLKDRSKDYCGCESSLTDIDYSTRTTMRDIENAKRSYLWRLMARLGYNKEARLIDSYTKDTGSALKRLFPAVPLPVNEEDMQKLGRTVTDALDVLSSLVSNEKELAPIARKVKLLSAQIEDVEVHLKHTTKLIDDLSLVPADTFKVKPVDAAKFEAVLRGKDPKANKFTKEQWDFILSTSRNTYVVAGAGSGKSTTLVYRALFLLKCAKVSLDKITIFTFTKKTRFELIDKFMKALKLFGDDLSTDDLKRIVHTFHSKAWGMAMGSSQQQFFDTLGKKNKKSHAVAAAAASSQENNDDDIETDQCISPNVNNEQSAHLVRVYAKLFNSNQDFKDIVCSLYKKIFMAGQAKEYKEDSYRIASGKNDLALIKKTRKISGKFVDDIDLHEREEEFKITHNGNQYPFYAHQKVMLPVDGIQTEYYVHYLPPHKDVKSACTTKKTIIVTHDAQRNHVFITNSNDYARWKKYKNDLFISVKKEKMEPPIFELSLPGYLTSKLFVNVLYAEGSFMENLGLEVADACAAIIEENGEGLDFLSLQFTKALGIFWKAFAEYLKGDEVEIKRYHEIFSMRYFENVRNNILRMQNVMIDEFQDINPEITEWIKSIIFCLKKDGLHCSITCVGDDYQSIYGWRGAAPVYFLNYEENFSSRNIHRIDMLHNFRSLQEIINAGERVLEDLVCKIDKSGKQGLEDIKPIDGLPVEVFPIQGTDAIDKTIKTIIEKYRGLDKSISIFIMSRTNEILDEVEKKLKGQEVDFMTYHRAKGLEADLCILLNDAFYNMTFPLRNVIYSMAWENQLGYDQTYDQAQKDEARRLGYVAITRAKKKVVILDNSAGPDGFIACVRDHLLMTG